MQRLQNNKFGLRYRIRNTITGQYIHSTQFRILEFFTVYDAYRYIKDKNLNDRIYIVEKI